MARNTIMGEIFRAQPSLEMQSGMTITAAAVAAAAVAAAAGSVLRYLPAYNRCRNIVRPFRQNNSSYETELLKDVVASDKKYI